MIMQTTTTHDYRVDLSRLKPGDTFTVAGKWYGVCVACRHIVRIDKPLLGSLHVCDDDG